MPIISRRSHIVRAHLYAGVCAAALAASPVLAADYTATDDTSFRGDITTANGDSDAASTITLGNDVTLAGGILATPAKPITIDTGSHTLTSVYLGGGNTSGAVNLNGSGPFPDGGTFIFDGTIQGASIAAGDGDQGLFLGARTSATNDGTIIGGAGGSVSGAGGTGVDVFGFSASANSTFINNGTVKGGNSPTGAGGVGVDVHGGSTFTNNGTVQGGTGQTTGGAGVHIVSIPNAATTFINNSTGIIMGGDSIGGTGTAGVVVGNGLNPIVNSGTVTGGNGAAAISYASTIAGSTITNSGTLNAGAGGADAIVVTSASANAALRLILLKGSVINGNVVGNTVTTNNTLTLGGDDNDSFDVSAIGPQYQNFSAFQKTGNSIWTLTGTATATTPWNISAGTLQLGDGASIIGDVINDATLAFNSSTSVTAANNISGIGAVVQAGSGTTTLTGTNSYSGGTILNAGTLSVADDANLGDAAGALTFNNGTLETTASFATARAVTLTGRGAILTDAGTTLTVSGVVTGAGGLSKDGDGTLVLTADNSYSGGTTIGGGTLQIGDGGTSGGIGGDVADNGALVFNRSDAATFSGAISGSGTVSQAGPGTTTLTGNSSYTGDTSITGGGLRISGGGTVNGTNFVDMESNLIVTGAGSAFTATGDLVAGRGAGTETITLDNGAHLTTGRSFLGEGSNQSTSSAIAITVDGAGSVWNAGDFVQLGAAAGGTVSLTVSNGGVMTARGGGVSIGRGGDGTALVTGAGSQLLSGDDVKIGISFNGGTGNGQLTIADGGLVTASTVALAYNDGVSIGNSGTLKVLGTPGARGVLETASLSKGYDAASATFDGGILRASAGGTDFISSYAGDFVTIGGGGMFIDTNGFDVTASSGLAGSGLLTKQGVGTLVLAAANTYAGGTAINAGTLQLGDGNSSGGITGNVADNGTLAFNRSDTVIFAGVISGSGGVNQIGSSTTILTGDNSYTGGTIIAAGNLQIGDGGTSGGIGGDVADNGVLVFNRSDAATFSGAISGSGSVAQTGGGNTTLSGANSYGGGTSINAGTLTGSATSFGSGAITDNAALAIDQAADATLANALNGTGSFTKLGAGRLNYTGIGSLSGPTTIAAGTLAVNGSLAASAVTVQSGATLGGNGTVSAVTALSGGTVAPGNSIGTLHVGGDYAQAAGSVYQVQIDPKSTASDLIAVSGAATLGSGAGLSVAKDRPGAYRLGTAYTVLHADGGVSGTYTLSGDTLVASPYLGLRDRYDADNAYLEVVQTADPAGAAQTGNQQQTAGGTNSLPGSGDVGSAVLNTPDPAATRDAFDQLSGEALASAGSMLISGSVLVRDTTFDRLRDVLCDTVAMDSRADCGSQPATVWAQGFGDWSQVYGSADAARVSQTTGGFLVGVDVPVAGWRLGFFGGHSRSDFDVVARNSAGISDGNHLGVYGGTAWGDLRLRLGASYSWNHLTTARHIAFGDFANDLGAHYSAGTAQVFGEVGQAFALDAFTVEPFANLAYVNLRTDGFSETGGAAALTSQANTMEDAFATFGVRPRAVIALGSVDLVAHGMLGWRHTFGSVAPQSVVAFAGGTAFTVAGAPIARDAGVVEAGLNTSLSGGASIGLTYGGQFSDRASDNSIRGTLAIAF